MKGYGSWHRCIKLLALGVVVEALLLSTCCCQQAHKEEELPEEESGAETAANVSEVERKVSFRNLEIFRTELRAARRSSNHTSPGECPAAVCGFLRFAVCGVAPVLCWLKMFYSRERSAAL